MKRYTAKRSFTKNGVVHTHHQIFDIINGKRVYRGYRHTKKSAVPLEGLIQWAATDLSGGGVDEDAGTFLDRINDNDPIVKRSYCAEGDGSTGFITAPASLLNTITGGDWSFALDFNYDVIARQQAILFGSDGPQIYVYAEPTGRFRMRFGTSPSVVSTVANYSSGTPN